MITSTFLYKEAISKNGILQNIIFKSQENTQQYFTKVQFPYWQKNEFSIMVVIGLKISQDKSRIHE